MSKVLKIFLLHIIIFLLFSVTSGDDDARCLAGINSALVDPNNNLNWNFGGNRTDGDLCTFTGVACWNFQENRVMALNLLSLSLSGEIPAALQFCSVLTNLDLSGNQLAGNISAELCDWLPYLVTLDLSNNQLSGPIPPELSKCQYLNVLNLAGNQLSGGIPSSLANLNRLVRLNLTNNYLSGSVPTALATKFDSTAFDGNRGLCGLPLNSRCKGNAIDILVVVVVIASIVVLAVLMILTYFMCRFCLRSCSNTYFYVPAHSLELICSSEINLIIIFVCGVAGGVIGLVVASK